MSDSWKECEGQVVDGEFPLLAHLGGSDHSVVFLTQRGKNNPEKGRDQIRSSGPAKRRTPALALAARRRRFPTPI